MFHTFWESKKYTVCKIAKFMSLLPEDDKFFDIFKSQEDLNMCLSSVHI